MALSALSSPKPTVQSEPEKNFTFGGITARQSSLAPAIVIHPVKKAR
jgi:hypothetical protein